MKTVSRLKPRIQAHVSHLAAKPSLAFLAILAVVSLTAGRSVQANVVEVVYGGSGWEVAPVVTGSYVSVTGRSDTNTTHVYGAKIGEGVDLIESGFASPVMGPLINYKDLSARLDGSGTMWGVNEAGGVDWINWNGASWVSSPLVSGNYVSVANKTELLSDNCYAARADGGIDWIRWDGNWVSETLLSGPTKYVDLAPVSLYDNNGFLFGVTDAGAVDFISWNGAWHAETIASNDYISVASRSSDGFVYASRAAGGIDLISWNGSWGAGPLLVSSKAFTDLATDLAGNDFIWATTAVDELGMYLLWARGFGLTNANDIALDLDFELDGLDNLTEYALGGNPTTNDAASINPTFSGPVNIGGTNVMEYVYSRRLDHIDRGLIYGLTVTTSDLILNNWTPIGTLYETGSGPIDVDFESVTNEIPTDTPIGFVNLEVTSGF